MQLNLYKNCFELKSLRCVLFSLFLVMQEFTILSALEKSAENRSSIVFKEQENAPNPSQQEAINIMFRTNLGDVVVQLYPEEAPLTCENFLKHLEKNTYNDATFYRVISGFVIQGGIETGGINALGKSITPVRNESSPSLKNVRGSIAMARTQNIDSATTEFFINLADNPHLDATTHENHNGYTVFGKVVSGMQVVDAIAQSKTDRSDRPTVPVKIESIARLSK